MLLKPSQWSSRFEIYSQAVMEALESAGVEFRDSVVFCVEEATLCVNALQP